MRHRIALCSRSEWLKGAHRDMGVTNLNPWEAEMATGFCPRQNKVRPAVSVALTRYKEDAANLCVSVRALKSNEIWALCIIKYVCLLKPTRQWFSCSAFSRKQATSYRDGHSPQWNTIVDSREACSLCQCYCSCPKVYFSKACLLDLLPFCVRNTTFTAHWAQRDDSLKVLRSVW